MYASHCAQCHGAEGEGRRTGNATALNNQDFLATASDAFIRTAIAEGRVGMPAFGRAAGGGLSDRDVADLVAFLRTWQQVPPRTLPARAIRGSVANGARLYSENCASCHGLAGKGELGMGPALNHHGFLRAAGDAYLWEAIAKGRRDTPMFPSLKGLGGVRELTEQEIDDLVVFLRSWPDRPGSADLPLAPTRSPRAPVQDRRR